MSRVLLSPRAAQKLKASPLEILSVRGLYLQVRGSTLHQGICFSPPGLTQPLLPFSWKVCPELDDV